MKKTIYLLNIDNYAPEITEVTYPFIEMYAEKIGAQIVQITERKFPEFAPVYEKLQIFELEKTRKSDWIIYIDSDALIHPDLFDITEQIGKDTVFQVGTDFSPMRFKKNKYMLRDGRNIGTCNWFTVFSDLTLDLYNPDIGMSKDEIIEHCFPTLEEKRVFDRTHLVDDYIIATNVAKYGLKYKNWKQLQDEKGVSGFFFFHQYLCSKEQKVIDLKKVADEWVNGVKPPVEGKPADTALEKS